MVIISCRLGEGIEHPGTLRNRRIPDRQSSVSIVRIGKLLIEQRGDRGIREVAAEIGISPATLSRVERGKLPDLLTFQKICKWLRIDPAQLLDVPPDIGNKPPERKASAFVAVHFRADATLSPAAAKDLAELILVAQEETLAET
jgi:transcriptional regulator with XRE-family HTH domain